jgi:predicted Zn-dependent peptidase
LNSKHQDPVTYRKTTLDNGIRIVTEAVPYLQSVSLGIWVRSGSRFERADQNGICHFIEHMVFKGTGRRSALDIAKEIDAVGGALNAFTSKELTCFYCRVLTENLEFAADLLTDIFLNASFPESEMDREKQVICQEIYQQDDSPEDYVHEIFGLRFWQDDPLGQPIMGTVPLVTGLDRNAIIDFKNRYYTPLETVICASGNLDHDRFVDLFQEMSKLSGDFSRGKPNASKHQPSVYIENRDIEQVHVCIGSVGPSVTDRRRHAAYILNTLLGGGWSSRLFQEVREQRGLAYSVYSFVSSFIDTGLFGIYAGCEPARLQELLDVTSAETLNLHLSLTKDEIRTAKSHIKGNFILAMESTDARMNRLAKCEYYFDRYLNMDEIIEQVEAVTPEQVAEAAEQMLGKNGFTIVGLGPVPDHVDFGGFSGSHV